MPMKTLGKQIGKSYCGVMIRMKQLGLEIPQEIIEQRKKQSQFRAGQESWNKGLKQEAYMTPENIEKTKKTRFKKGNQPHNTAKKNGVIRLRKDTKTGISYKYIRVSLGEWELYQRYVWQKANGPIPEGYCIRFKDSDSQNCELENLELISRAENLQLNWHNYPENLKKAIKLTNKIQKEL